MNVRRERSGSVDFRGDVEGLRAVAVTLVVLGHAGVAGLAGGYVGVDVFFVISGFLITSLLLREFATTGRVAVSRFYARRAMRLLPLSSLVLAATLYASWRWLSPLRAAEYAADTVAAAFSAVNVRLALAGTDYMAADAAPSPLQHFWSLAVEEQFYLVWPLLMLATCTLWRRGRRIAAVGVLVGLTGGSFALSVWQTGASAPWAYFGPHTRAWELGVGALIALGVAPLRRLPAPVAVPLGWVGLVTVVAAAVVFDGRTAFPGALAAVPVCGAAAIIAAGAGPGGARHGVAALLALPPLQFVGRLSYGWYLWHWPLLMIVPTAWGWQPDVWIRLALCAGALLLAWCTFHLVEAPTRRLGSLRTRPVWGLGLGLALSAAVTAGAVTVAAAPPTVPVGGNASDLQAAVTDRREVDPARTMTAFIRQAGAVDRIPANLRPSLLTAGDDLPQVYADGCHVEARATDIAGPCVYGDPTSATTVVLFGDSHAAQWFPAMRRLAVQRRWRLISLTKAACTATGAPIMHEALKRPYTECRQWHRRTLLRIARLQPGLVVVGSSFAYRLVDARTDAAAQWRSAWDGTVGALQATGAAVALVADTPYMGGRVPTCLAENPRRISRCARTLASALRGPEQRRLVLGYAGDGTATVIDPTPWMCADTCPAVLGNVLVYRDSNHITTTFSGTLAPLLGARLPAPRPD